MLNNNLHSHFLIHWTGREDNQELNDEGYVHRLKDCYKYGLCMNKGKEKINGSDNTWIVIGIARTCFTENRLSKSTEEHLNRYGRMGIGFHRDFVIERHGNPVFYLFDGNSNVIIKNLDYIRSFLETHDTQKLKELEILLGYCKNMNHTEENSFNDNFSHYDEMEWRIVHLEQLEKNGKIVPDTINEKIDFRLVFEPRDVKIIVLPNDQIKKTILEDEEMNEHFSKNLPIITTIDESKNF